MSVSTFSSGSGSIDLHEEFKLSLDQASGMFGAKAYNTMCASSGAIAASSNATQLSWQAILHGFLLAAGYAKQYDAIEKQGDLAAAQKDAVERNMAIAEGAYNNITLPAYKQADEYFFKFYRKTWEPKLAKIAECGLGECEYTPDYNKWIGRGIADVARVVNGAKRANKRALDCFSAGSCCDQDYRLAELQARLTVETIQLGRIYEDERKDKRDAYYWNKYISVSQMILNIGSMAANLQNSGKASLVAGINSVTSATAGFDRAVESGFSALSKEAGFYGQLGGLAGSLSGSAYGGQVGQQITGNPLNSQFALNQFQPASFNPSGPQFTNGTPGQNRSGWQAGSAPNVFFPGGGSSYTEQGMVGGAPYNMSATTSGGTTTENYSF